MGRPFELNAQSADLFPIQSGFPEGIQADFDMREGAANEKSHKVWAPSIPRPDPWHHVPDRPCF